MAYTFHEVNIFAYDLHTTVAPLINDTLFAEDLRFLSTTYQDNYEKRVEVNTASFKITPLPVKDQNHFFWSSYGAIFRRGNYPDFWRLQIPFLCEVKNMKVELDLSDINVEAGIEPKIFLSALGWSTNLEIRLTGDISSEKLISIVNRLFEQQQKPYKVDGVPQTITGLFGRFASQIRAELYTRQKPPIDRVMVEKYFVISPADFSGKIQYYCPPNKDEHPSPSWATGLSGDERMSQSDCALMLSFLYGQSVSINDWYQWSYEQFLHTKMKGPSFALTNYDRGTFIFLQQNAANKKRNALWCFASNVRYCTMMTALLLRFYDLSMNEVHYVVANKRSDIRTILREMPINYPNAVCANIHRFNRDVKEILSPSA
jgi:hypothetical protein